MQERSSKNELGNRSGNRGQGKPDPNVTALSIVQMATGQIEKPELRKKNEAAVTLGRLGGLKGGKARAAKMTPERRKEIAQKAAEARWAVDASSSKID